MLPNVAISRFVFYVLAILLAVFTYFYGLDSPHIPKNGDEFPYAHITRLTAGSGHLLPLQSQLHNMRNTKPPLLFWQGIASTHWGQEWSWWNLRYPSVIYTLLTALLVFLLAQRLVRNQGGAPDDALETGFIAALTFLAFFSTYRFGRPFLVNPAEVFWFFLPFFTLLYWRSSAFDSRLVVPLLLGIEVGIGLLYKSFALVAPVAFALSWWYLHQRDYRLNTFLRKDSWKVAITVAVSLALFSLWFVFDPDPQAVWREFIVGENAGKFDPRSGSYLGNLLWGGSSIWALLVGYPMNAGLLAFPVMAVFWVTYRRRAVLSDAEKMLWIWMVVLFIVFSVPSQRTARYLLEAMPGLAVLCALNWQRISRLAFVVSLLFAGSVLALITFLSWRLQLEMPGAELYSPVYWLLLSVTGILTLLAIFWSRRTRMLVNVVALLVLLVLAAFLRPLDGAPGNFSAEAQRYARGKEVWTPCNFRAVDEGYRFLLPGAQVHGYFSAPAQSVAELSAKYALFAVQVPLQEKCEGCKIIGQRLEIRSRHSPEEIKKILQGQVFQQLFTQELLVESSQTLPALPLAEGCR
ncbi:MAG: glycosyl transferase family 39 [Gallionellaceae bacterium]|jgi:4-amino-4-deoxy-L-arabinose transferase-like glycosyltransferase